MHERTIIHLNIADFSVAVERLKDHSLRGRPLIIAPQAVRATVYDMSEEAYQDGVRKGMPLIYARRRCRRANILPPRPEDYEKAMQCCIRRVLRYSPQVERAHGQGHLYLDVTGSHRLFGPPPDIGWRIRKTLRNDPGLDPIWSVGPNKLIAKVASRIVKPSGEYIVAGGEEHAFLSPLPLSLLPTLKPRQYRRLREVGISRIGQAATLSLQELSILCGGQTDVLYHSLQGVDHTPSQDPVQDPTRAEKQFFFQQFLAEDSNREEIIRPALLHLARQAGFALRKQKLACRKIRIKLLYSDTISCTRQAACKIPIFLDQDLEQLAISGLFRCWRRRVRIRSISLGCRDISPRMHQLSLFHDINKKNRKNIELNKTIDKIHERFGQAKLYKGVMQ